MADCDVLGPHHGEGADDNPIRGSRLIMQGLEDIETTMRSELTDIFSAELNARTKGLKHIQTPADVFSRDPVMLQVYNKLLYWKKELIFKKQGRMEKRAKSIIKKHSISEQDVPRLIDHAEALRMTEDGNYIQTIDNPDPRLDKAAKELRKRYYDVVFKDETGINPQVLKLFKQEGMPFDQKNIREVIRLMKGGIPERGTSPAHYSISEKARGLIDLEDLSFDRTLSYEEGYFTLIPIKNEYKVLEGQISELDQQLASGMVSPEEGAKLSSLLEQKKARFDQLNAQMEAQVGRDFPKMESLPKHHFSEYFSVLKKKPRDALIDGDEAIAPQFDIETNMDSIFERYTANSYNKRFFDKVLYEVKQVTESQGVGVPPLVRDPDLRNYAVTWANAMRGTRGFLEDRFIVDTVNSVKKRFGRKENFTQPQLRNYVSETMKLQAMLKLFINPVFSIVNSLQTAMTVYPLFGAKAYGKALAEAFSPVYDALRAGDFSSYDLVRTLYSDPDAVYGYLAKKSAAWRRAKAAGILDEADRFLVEAEVKRVHGVENLIKAVPGFTEMLNRVIAYNAGVNHIISGNKAIPIFKTFYVPPGTKSLRRIAHAHGDAAVKATQFMFGTEGRPLGFVGGSVRRLTTQFKSFTISYGTLMKDTVRLGRKTGDWGPFGRMVGTLWLFGGVPAVAGPMVFYDDVRRWMIRNTGLELPNSSGLSSIMERTGLGFASPFDITGSVEPFKLPRKPSEILPYLAGPTFGSGLRIGEKASEFGLFSPETAESTVSAVSPLLSSMARGGRQASEGGLFSDTGELLARQGSGGVVAESLGLRQPTKVVRGNYLRDLEEALIGGHDDLADDIKRRGEREGIVFGPKTMAALKGRVSRRLKDGERGFFEQFFR